MRHFINFSDLDGEELRRVLALARELRREVRSGHRRAIFSGRLLLMLFEQPSTRTQVSFMGAMAQGGGAAQVLSFGSSQLARGESVADTARAVSGMCDAVVIRTRKHDTIAEFAAHSACPVVNGLSDLSHPCQVLADVLTCQDLKGGMEGLRIAWIGDCNNVFYSWSEAARIFGCTLAVACPPKYRPSNLSNKWIVFVDSPLDAVVDADVVMTDVWASMADDSDERARDRDFDGYTVDGAVMKAAKKDAVFMHCLPAKRGREVSAEVIDGGQSVVWQQAENRLHAQKALLAHLWSVGDVTNRPKS